MERITERENALLILEHSSEAQYIPLDPMQIVFMSPVREKAPMFQDGEDWFGCPWIWDAQTFGHAPDLRKPPVLDGIENWKEKLVFPDLDEIDWEAAAAQDMAEVDSENKLIQLFFEMGIFERSHILLGVEEAFVAMKTETEEYSALLEALTDYKISILNKVLPAYKPDLIMWHDDLGTSNAPMISVEDYRNIIKPLHKRIFDCVHSHRVMVNYHSCGYMAPFIPDLIDLGVEIINPIQPCNGWEELASEYGDSVCFNVDCAPKGDTEGAKPEELIEDVRRCIDIFGPHRCLFTGHFPSNMAVAEANMPVIMGEIAAYGATFYQTDKS